MQYCTVQYITVQHSTVQYSAVQYSTAQFSTAQCSTAQCSTAATTCVHVFVAASSLCGLIIVLIIEMADAELNTMLCLVLCLSFIINSLLQLGPCRGQGDCFDTRLQTTDL